jgi:hypothetical protein
MIVLLNQIAPGLKKVLLRLSSEQLGEDAAGLIGTTLRGADSGSDSLAVTTTDNNNGASSGTQSAAITIANTTTVTEAVPATLSGNENTAISLTNISVSDTPTLVPAFKGQ